MKQIILLFGLSCLFFSFKAPFIGIEYVDIEVDIDHQYKFHPSLGYTSKRGIGNNSGFTTLQALITPDYVLPGVQAFTDLRGHIFDQGRFAGNAGAGLRYSLPDEERILGGNIYYDFRNTARFKHKTFQQIGFGFEFLTYNWDIRGNAYCPFGSRKSHCHPHGKFNVCFGGGDLELGTSMNQWACDWEFVHVYAAAGPYYYKAVDTDGILGGRMRLSLSFNEYIFLEGRLTYDHYFKTRGQGLVRIVIPFSDFYSFFCRILVDESEKPSECLRRKITEAPFRNEIIPISHKR